MSRTLIAKGRAVTGSLPAAVLLVHITHSMASATSNVDSHLWIAKSAVEWCFETGLTFDQYRRAMGRLKSLGLVIVERHRLGDQAITHVRLTEAGRQALIPQPEEGGGRE